MEKGQITVEFIMVFIIVVLFFTGGVFIYQHRISMNYVAQERREAQQTADTIARAITELYLADDNSSYTQYIYWDKGKVEASSNSVRVFATKGGFYDSHIPPQSSSWSFDSIEGHFKCTKRESKVECEIT